MEKARQKNKNADELSVFENTMRLINHASEPLIAHSSIPGKEVTTVLDIFKHALEELQQEQERLVLLDDPGEEKFFLETLTSLISLENIGALARRSCEFPGVDHFDVTAPNRLVKVGEELSRGYSTDGAKWFLIEYAKPDQRQDIHLAGIGDSPPLQEKSTNERVERKIDHLNNLILS